MKVKICDPCLAAGNVVLAPWVIRWPGRVTIHVCPAHQNWSNGRTSRDALALVEQANRAFRQRRYDHSGRDTLP